LNQLLNLETANATYDWAMLYYQPAGIELLNSSNDVPGQFGLSNTRADNIESLVDFNPSVPGGKGPGNVYEFAKDAVEPLLKLHAIPTSGLRYDIPQVLHYGTKYTQGYVHFFPMQDSAVRVEYSHGVNKQTTIFKGDSSYVLPD